MNCIANLNSNGQTIVSLKVVEAESEITMVIVAAILSP